MSIDKQNAKVTMSLSDYESLEGYRRAYKELIKEIKGLAYINKMTNENIIVVVNKKQAQDFIVPFAAEDCELDGYPDGVIVIWEE